MNVVVLAGGLSTERNVSIASGKMVYTALKAKGENAILLDVYLGYTGNIDNLFETGYDFSEYTGISKETEPDLEQVKKLRDYESNAFIGKNVIELCQKADIVFMALHGENGENGKLQATFDIMGIKYTGSGYLGSAVSLNKGLSKTILDSSGIKTPRGTVYTLQDKANGQLEKWNYFPCVVKPCSGGSSVGVYIVEHKEDFIPAMEKSFVYEEEVLVEQFVKGREFSVGVLGGKALPIIEICPKEGFYDYKNKYNSGLTEEICPAILDESKTKEMQGYAERAYKALMLDAYGRIDFLMDAKGEMYCLEANTLPGMTNTSLLPQEAQATGLDFDSLCIEIIKLSLNKYN